MNIYVSHLSWGTKGDSLQNLFSQYGEVSSANVITDRETGRSRGFGFVEMPNDAEGQAAIDALDGTDFEGKTIGVNVAKPKAGPAVVLVKSGRPAGLRAVTAAATVAAATAAATAATGDTDFPRGIYHPCFMRLRQGSLFARSVRATGSSPEGAAYRKGAGGRRGIGRKGETAGRTGRGCQAGAHGDHTRISPESRRG